MAFISVVTGTFNEEENVAEFYERVSRVFSEHLHDHTFELIVIDNASTDGTVAALKRIAAADRRVKVIVNNRNFGLIRSGTHAFLQAKGDAIVLVVSDLQDPPEMIADFVQKWQQGYKVVLAQKISSEEPSLLFLTRKAYYKIVNRLSDIELVQNVTGFGLYERCVVEDIRGIGDRFPYFRGLICDLGYEQALIQFDQPARKRGFSKNNFYSLWDLAMLGITSHSRVPLRLATLAGFLVGATSFFVALFYLGYKLAFWSSFQVGTAPLVIGLFFLGAVQLFTIGILGEYIGSMHTQLLRRPLVIEKERINFD